MALPLARSANLRPGRRRKPRRWPMAVPAAVALQEGGMRLSRNPLRGGGGIRQLRPSRPGNVRLALDRGTGPGRKVGTAGSGLVERGAADRWHSGGNLFGGRGITCLLPNTLRFHCGCWHLTAKRFQAMLARVDRARGMPMARSKGASLTPRPKVTSASSFRSGQVLANGKTSRPEQKAKVS